MLQKTKADVNNADEKYNMVDVEVKKIKRIKFKRIAA